MVAQNWRLLSLVEPVKFRDVVDLYVILYTIGNPKYQWDR